jgi:hypothetical protein
VLAVTLLFVLAAISVSTGLVVYTAWLHDLENGFFALLFATLSVRAALSWCLCTIAGQPLSRSTISKTAKGESRRTKRCGRLGPKLGLPSVPHHRPSPTKPKLTN